MSQVSEVVKFILDEVLKRVPIPKLPDAIVAILPIVSDLLQSDVVLSADARMEIQVRVMRALRSIGLEGHDL